MPLFFSTKAKLVKKMCAAQFVFNQLTEPFEYKAVYKAVGKRQDQQKYLRQHLRAEEFMRAFPYATDVELWMKTCYSRSKWEETDVKKVYYHTN